MLNKKGQSLQVSTVILIILALLVLIIIAVIVTGGFAEFAEKIGIFKSTTISVDEARLKCQSWCNTENDNNYCDMRKFDIDINGNGEIDSGETYGCRSTAINIECPAISCGA